MKNLLLQARDLTRKGDLFINKHGIDHFDEEATRLLLKTRISEAFDYQTLVETSMKPGFNKIQNFHSFEFSDLPITVSRGENCFVDIYFWRRRPTVIHNHHFSGAFQCLLGKNIDFEFEFKKKRKLGKHHILGDVRMMNARVLKQGDIATIGFMDKFIHQNHHHADLTVNLCFRTPEVKGSNIANYLYSGLRYDKDRNLLARVNRLLRFTGLEKFDFKKVDIDLDDAINLLIQTYGTTSQNPRLLNLRKYLERKVKSEAGMDINKLLRLHEQELDRLEEDYD